MNLKTGIKNERIDSVEMRIVIQPDSSIIEKNAT
jgi:hypothetical protein